MGYYEDCAIKLDELFDEEMDAPANQQLLRMQSVRQMVEKAAKMEKTEIFNPRDNLDSRWEIIKRMKNKKPITENRFLFTFTAPIVFLLGILVMNALGDTALGTIAVFLIILFLFATITRLSNSLLNNLNRHALDLDRAIDFESTSGKICIPDEIRESKLYASMMDIKTPALKERMEMIITSGEKLAKKWELNVP
jgi:ABC-type transport system involved in cytochrome bd biosynthesis fused ATPase/permease subunit